VLSVHRLPVDKELVRPYKQLLIEVDDVEDENLLQYFTTTNGFIQEGLDGGGGGPRSLVSCFPSSGDGETLQVSSLRIESIPCLVFVTSLHLLASIEARHADML